MSDGNQLPNFSARRLRFIDMARSIAILMMLEGHFITLTLGDEYKNLSNPIYYVFLHIRGLTAPLFFSVTGLIFVYLLTSSSSSQTNYFTNIRVKKGFKRVGELFIWAYLLQFNFVNAYRTTGSWDKEIVKLTEKHNWNFFSYLIEKNGMLVYSFHVLHCISIGILLLLVVYGLTRIVKVIPFHWMLFLFGSLIVCFYPYLKVLDDHLIFFPSNAPVMIQNAFVGPHSVFPIVPFCAFVLFGGMLGALIRKYELKTKTVWFPLLFVFSGLIIIVFNHQVRMQLDQLLHYFNWVEGPYFEYANVVFGRFGQVIILLGFLMLIENYGKLKDSLFLKIGQNTLPIFVLHVIILYGGVLGFGIDSIYKFPSIHGSFFEKPTFVIVGAILFILLFVVVTKYLENIENFYHKVIQKLFFWKKKPVTTRHIIIGSVIICGCASAIRIAIGAMV